MYHRARRRRVAVSGAHHQFRNERGTMQLTEGQIAYFKAFGFLKFPGLFAEDIDSIVDAFEGIWAAHGSAKTNPIAMDEVQLQFIIFFCMLTLVITFAALQWVTWTKSSQDRSSRDLAPGVETPARASSGPLV